eukprot:2922443-Rhodomonas_salina.3
METACEHGACTTRSDPTPDDAVCEERSRSVACWRARTASAYALESAAISATAIWLLISSQDGALCATRAPH